jgi:4a-hydroxytetrahydrobiopterin dehydratase
MALLSNAEIQEKIKGMQGWSSVGNTIQKKYTFASFLPAIAFVNKIAQAAERADHHPDITINYNQVGISLSTHSKGGVTDKDFNLAGQIDQIRANLS